MKLTIENKQEQSVLERTRITGKIVFEGCSPSKKDVQVALAKEIGVEPGLIAVQSIYVDYGRTIATITAYQYKNEAAFKKHEAKPKKKSESSDDKADKEPAKPEKPEDDKDVKVAVAGVPEEGVKPEKPEDDKASEKT